MSEKPWDRPWSMEEIIENSEKWNLAGDVALLNTLKSFAENLISKTTEINNNLNNLTNELDEKALKLNIAQNEFQSLRNSQFIESRVYEDDETLPQTENNEKFEEKIEPDRTDDIRLAAMKGLEVLEQYFEKIEVSVSDSEDEELDLPNCVLRPKDLYLDRPLPYVIGSEEWHKNWHVGLEDSSSDSETEKVSDKYSESDSESDLPIIQDKSQINKGTSDTSSEIDFSQKPNKISSKQEILFQSSDSEDQNCVQANKNFAEELAAKLGNMIKQEIEEPEINRRPIQINPQYGDLFFDEPPPLDEPKGLFSGGSGLFDDDDEDIQYSTLIESKIEESPKLSKGLFEKENDIFNTKSQPLFPPNKPPLFISEEPPGLDEKKKPVGGVSILGGKDIFNKKLLRRQPSSSDEEVKEGKVPKKRIDLFIDDYDDSDDIFKTEEKLASSNKKNILFDGKNDTESNEEVKKVSLFDDDDDDLFKDDLFSTKNKLTSTGLFDDDDDVEGNDLFSNKTDDKPRIPGKNLFEDLMGMPDNKNSINVDGKIEVKSHPSLEEKKVDVIIPQESVSKLSSSNNLFEDIPGSTDLRFDETLSFKPKPPKPRPRVNLFDSPPPEGTDDLFSDESHTKKEEFSKDTPDFSKKTGNKLKTGLFDSPIDDEQDDIFKEKKNLFTSSILESEIFTESGKDTKPVINTTPPSLRLFDPVPPPDDDWEIKSENISDDNQSFTDQDDVETPKANLFSEEPPSLDVSSKTSGKVSNITEKFENEPKEEFKENTSSPGKLKHNLNINVSALMPGSLPPKRTELQKKTANVIEEPPTEIKDSFDGTDNVEVLHSVTKDRVKVPLRRRPSTRRGRQAALRNSSSDFKLDDTENVTKSSKSQDFIEPKTSTKVFEATVAKPLMNEDLFEAKSTENLFEAAETKPSKSQAKPSLKTDLFGEDDGGDDDMFSSRKVSIQQRKIVKKSLFDDDDTDDDNDIFKRSTETEMKNPEIKIPTERKIAKVSSIKKLENTKVDDDDPLSALLK